MIVNGTVSKDPQPVEHNGIRSAVFSWRPVEDFAAANGQHLPVLTDDETITGQSKCGFFEPNLNECGFARLQCALSEQNNIAHQFGSSDVESYSFPHLNRTGNGGEQFQMT